MPPRAGIAASEQCSGERGGSAAARPGRRGGGSCVPSLKNRLIVFHTSISAMPPRAGIAASEQCSGERGGSAAARPGRRGGGSCVPSLKNRLIVFQASRAPGRGPDHSVGNTWLGVESERRVPAVKPRNFHWCSICPKASLGPGERSFTSEVSSEALLNTSIAEQLPTRAGAFRV